MRDAFALEIANARRFERRGDQVRALIHWAGASRVAVNDLERLEALTNARRCAEESFAQAVVDANEAGYAWRDLAPHTDLAWQTLHRRYGHLVQAKDPSRRRRRC